MGAHIYRQRQADRSNGFCFYAWFRSVNYRARGKYLLFFFPPSSYFLRISPVWISPSLFFLCYVQCILASHTLTASLRFSAVIRPVFLMFFCFRVEIARVLLFPCNSCCYYFLSTVYKEIHFSKWIREFIIYWNNILYQTILCF